jgi:cytochrome c oxidase subunit 2
MTSGRRALSILFITCGVVAVGCGGPQSALDVAGRDAERIARLFVTMTVGTLVVWALVVVLAVYAIRARDTYSEQGASLLIVGGGVLLPTVVLAALLAYGLPVLPELLRPASAGSLQIEVTGKQWWWRVRYLRDRGVVETANELRLPVGQRINLRLISTDVIHSFWVPSIAGKMDMIPGRITHLALEPTRTGVFRGVCAEYCGTSHALMAFHVIVVEPEEFDAWLEHQAEPAQAPPHAQAAQGETAFVANGCAACHTVRGATSAGTIGPDLTHVGSRLHIGAGTLPNQPDALARWVAQTDTIKPGVHMPEFHTLPRADLSALAAYLDNLQ